MPGTPEETKAPSSNFVAQDWNLLARADKKDEYAEFERFLGETKRLLLRELPHKLDTMRSSAEQIQRWLIPLECDLFEIARTVNDENAYTNLIAWSLSPATHPPTALRRQQAWLSALGIPESKCITFPVEPMLRLCTDDGFPDLVLRYPTFVVVVEAKTKSEEHDAPSGRPQTEAYPHAVRRRFALECSFPLHMVFLTPTGTPAKNPEAINTTYREFAFALARELTPGELPEDVRYPYKLFFSHLIAHVDPSGVEICKVMNALADVFASPQGTVKEGILLSNLKAVYLLFTLFDPKGVGMADFRSFSPAARLYLGNLPVVEAVRQVFEKDIQRFLDSLQAEIQVRVGPLIVKYKTFEDEGKEWSAWWIARSLDGTKPPWIEKLLPWVIFDLRAPVLERKLECYVPGEPYLKTSEAHALQIVKLADDPELKQFAVRERPEDWALLSVTIEYSEEDMMEKIATVISTLLRKLDSVRDSQKQQAPCGT